MKNGSGETPSGKPSVLDLPLMSFVKGGTTTSAHDRAQAEQTADAEARRAVDDQYKLLAKKPIEEGGGIIHGGPLSGQKDQAYVELIYCGRSGEPLYEFGELVRCLADVVMVGDTELAVVVVCIRCKKRGVPLDRCQMRVRQSNKHFELSSKRAGELIRWDEVSASGSIVPCIYKSAGTIVESEKFRCDQCGWQAVIDDNRVREL